MPCLMRAVGVPLLSANVAGPMGPESRVMEVYFAIVYEVVKVVCVLDVGYSKVGYVFGGIFFRREVCGGA